MDPTRESPLGWARDHSALTVNDRTHFENATGVAVVRQNEIVSHRG